jgi:hypothetical protein
MLRFAGWFRFLHQREKGFLQNILRFTMSQAQRTAIKNQSRRFRFVELFKPIGMFVVVHGFVI